MTEVNYHCPNCGNKLEYTQSHKANICMNDNCPLSGVLRLWGTEVSSATRRKQYEVQQSDVSDSPARVTEIRKGAAHE